MDNETLVVKIHELYASGANQKLKELVLGALGQLREKTLKTIEALLPNSDGKFRLKLLEILMTDGGADLIPLFIEAIRDETNLLYAKSTILLFRGFRHQEALAALLSVENQIPGDLKSTYQSALGKLLSRFSEEFYMNEFRAGLGFPRRVKFAADMMLRAPNPLYIPFLNQQILVNDEGFRTQGVRVLRKQGDETSLDALFTLSTKIRRQAEKAVELEKILGTNHRSAKALFLELTKRAGLDWDDERIVFFLNKILAGDPKDALEQVLDRLELSGEIYKKVYGHLKDMLSAQLVTSFEEGRIGRSLSDFRTQLDELLNDAVSAMGEIALRVKRTDFVELMERYLPPNEPARDALLISAMSGFTTPESARVLSDYINTCDDELLIEKSLVALAKFPLEEIPRGVEKLCLDEKNGVLRQKALQLLGQTGRGLESLGKALESGSIAVRADAIKVISDYKLAECQPQLVALLRPNQPDSILLATLEGLAGFDSDATGQAVKKYLLPPNTLSMRKGALVTLIQAGGPDRHDHILKTFEMSTIAKMGELVGEFLVQIQGKDFQLWVPHLLHYREFWLRLLREQEHQELKLKIIAMMERIEVEEEYQIRMWTHGIAKAIQEGVGSKEIEDRLRKLLDHFEEALKKSNVVEQHQRNLDGLIQTIDKQHGYLRQQALRKLYTSLKPELLQNVVGLRRLVRCMSDMLMPDAEHDQLQQSMQIILKIRHPKLIAKIKIFTEHPNAAIRGLATQILNAGSDPQLTHPIRSVLVLDDSRYITLQLSKVLKQNELQADCVNAVSLGFDSLNSKRYDLLILDYVMPDMDGIEFLTQIRERGIAPEYVLIITSTRNQEDLQKFIRAKVDGILLKPFRMEEMITRIKELETHQ